MRLTERRSRLLNLPGTCSHDEDTRLPCHRAIYNQAVTRSRASLVLAAVVLLGAFLGLRAVLRHPPQSTVPPAAVSPALTIPSARGDHPETPTTLWAHNIRLRKGPIFRIYINWMRGQMLPANPALIPSLDEPNSFQFRIEKGVIHANLADFGNYLNSAAPATFPLKNIRVGAAGSQIRLTGTLHKLLLPLPIELLCDVAPASRGRTVLHVTRINVLKLPMKFMLGGMHVTIDDIIGKDPIRGIEVTGNDLFFDTTTLLPPPHISGQLTSTTVAGPDLVLIFGNAKDDEAYLNQWHNFLRLTGGTINFGNLTMHPADLTLVDASKDVWFDLDLVHYQAQLLQGFSRITAQAGLEMFMPSLDEQHHTKPSPSLDVEWLRNRNERLPADVPVH